MDWIDDLIFLADFLTVKHVICTVTKLSARVHMSAMFLDQMTSAAARDLLDVCNFVHELKIYLLVTGSNFDFAHSIELLIF